MWHRARLRSTRKLRSFCTAVRRHIEDEGDWSYSSEWWGDNSDGHTLLRSTSDKGNGVVSVVAHHSSRPVPFSPFCLYVSVVCLFNLSFNGLLSIIGVSRSLNALRLWNSFS